MELPPFLIKPLLSAALEQCKWPGRFQQITHHGVHFYLDGAHTKESVQHCANWYNATRLSDDKPSKTTRILVFNSTADRRPEDLLRPLMECGFHYAVFCPNCVGTNVSAASDIANFTVERQQQLTRCTMQEEVWKSLAHAEVGCTTRCFESVSQAIQWIEGIGMSSGDAGTVEVLVTGSLHLVGSIMTLLDPTLEHLL